MQIHHQNNMARHRIKGIYHSKELHLQHWRLQLQTRIYKHYHCHEFHHSRRSENLWRFEQECYRPPQFFRIQSRGGLSIRAGIWGKYRLSEERRPHRRRHKRISTERKWDGAIAENWDLQENMGKSQIGYAAVTNWATATLAATVRRRMLIADRGIAGLPKEDGFWTLQPQAQKKL